MKNILFKVLILAFMMIIGFGFYNYVSVNASENEYTYSYTYNGITYYSNESEDDAWYQAMLDNYEKGLITEEQIEEEYSTFSRRNLNEIADTYDNQSDLTGEPVTYVNGYLTWTTSTGYVLPLKNMRVDLYNDNILGAEWLGSTYTNLDGYYCFEFINDTSWIENGGYDVFIRCYPDSYTFEIARDWVFSFLTYYYFETEPILNVTSGTTTDFNVRVLYDESNMGNRAFYISQGLVTAQRFALEMGMETDEFLHVIYPFSDNYTAFCLDEYSGIGKPYFSDFDTIMHEYGHFVEGVLGNYGSSLVDIILYNPNHYSHTDHFYDKNNKQFAMDLTWSESWATAFAQIAQQKYLTEYNGKVSGYGDIFDGENYETYISTLYSCEAQEDAVIASLWDLFDSGTNESYDNMSLSYAKWWEMTTRNNIQTLTDFFEVVNEYYPEYRSQVGEIFGTHQISPSNLTITNLSNVSEDVAPQFSWTVNGSTYNPNNQFKLVFYNSDGTLVYQTELFTSNLQYNQTYTYSMSSINWNSVLSNFTNVADLNIVVQGFHSASPISGPYNSKYVSLSIEFTEHSCDYSYRYLPYNSSKHKSICSCGDYVLRPHAVSASQAGRYKTCVDCGYLVDTYSDIVIVGPYSLNNTLNSDNGSYTLPNGVIVLMDSDINSYLNGTLVLYLKDDEKY